MAQELNDRNVVGVFEDYKMAERAVRDLTTAGIPRESIEVKSNFMTGTAGHSTHSEESQEGGISGFFHRLFGGEESNTEAGHYSEALRRGNAVVTVTGSPDQMERAADIMNSAGAIDIDRQVERFRQTGYQGYDPGAPPYTYDQAVSERERLRSPEGAVESERLRGSEEGAERAQRKEFHGSDEGRSIPVVEEELQVGKRVVRRGGVRIYSHVVEHPVEQKVELREERVRVERRPVDRAAGSGDADRLQEQSVEVTEYAEEPVIQKRTRVREEVVISKDTTMRTEQVRDNVKRTEVEVERMGQGEGAAARSDYRSEFRRDWQERYANSGQKYETYEPAYDYGYRVANEPRYRGRNWSDVEDDLRTDYMRTNPNSSWDTMKGAVRYGWEKVTGKR